MHVRLILSILIFSYTTCFVAPAVASTYIDIKDVETYAILSRLEAEGVVTDELLSTKPLSRKECIRILHEAETNAQERGEFVKSLVMALKQRLRPEESEAGVIKPLDSAYINYINTNADVLTLTYGSVFREKEQAFNQNNDGDLYDRGSNFRTGFTSRAEDLAPFSAYLNPEFRSDGNNDLILKKGYGVLGFFSWIDIVAGKDSQWWGPGYNGSIILSNNAEPFTMIKLTNPVPLTLPWVFKYLGPFRYSLFVTRLEAERIGFSRPYLWGMRFDFKPNPIIEIGLHQTEMLGGQQNLSTWLDSVIGTNKHNANSSSVSDGRAGYDLKLTLPFRLQPVQAYFEAGAEDNIHVIPSKWAYLFGIYLPRIFSLERIGLRAEYATTHTGNNTQPVWYVHSGTGGYTYNEMIIGHHMGTDSQDFLLELSYLMPETNGRFFLSYDQKTHNITEPVSEVSREILLTAEFMVYQHVDITGSYGYGRIENPENMVIPSLTVNEIAAELRYWF